MKINVDINPLKATNDFAKVTLRCEDPSVEGILDLDFSTLYARCQIPDPVTLDFLFLASVVYGVDRLIPRTEGDDRWARTFELCVPVSDSEKWSTVTDSLQTCLGFLTGDDWTIRFKPLSDKLHCPEKIKESNKSVEANAVCLFSGGLDSLIGAIDYLESGQQPFLVGHYTLGHGPKSNQENLHEMLEREYGSLNLLQVRVGLKTPDEHDQEKTYRSRSFLFIALGMYAARSIGKQIPLLIPENGTIALNPPLTPSRQGSCSTRTAHPFFLNMLCKILVKLGVENTLHNPHKFKTKGECVDGCRNKALLHDAVRQSVSCAKGGHRNWRPNRDAAECGTCMPCIYRRASLHKVGWDNGEDYGYDICCNVDLDSNLDHPNDLRALVSFLYHNPPREDISDLLLVNGNIELTHLLEYADVVVRGMDEVRTLLQDKCTDERIIQRAGLAP